MPGLIWMKAFGQATRRMFLRDDFGSTYLNQSAALRQTHSQLLAAQAARRYGFLESMNGSGSAPSALAATAWTLVVFLFGRRVAGSRRERRWRCCWRPRWR
ncbi:MAG: hypothetical protein IPK09_00015 [Candidatus Competibacteraceae bacterium]|nr:hypothetical protein [Candidatus Competibacteraceae bacterium]